MQINNEKQTAKPKNAGFFDFLKTVKPFQEIHKKNSFASKIDLVNETKTYTEATEALKHKPYAMRIKPILNTIKIFLGSYNLLSVITGFAVAYFATTLIVGDFKGFFYYTSFALSMLILGFLVVLNEYAKVYACNNYFGQSVKELKFLVFLTFVFSVAMSVGGGLLINEYLNKSFVVNVAKANHKSNVDSLETFYNDQIRLTSEGLKDNKAKQESKHAKKNPYLTLSLQQVYKENQSNILKLKELELKEKELKSQNLETLLTENKKELENKGFYLSLVITVLEILFIVLYRVKITIYQNIKTENINENIVPNVDNSKQENTNFLDIDLDLLAKLHLLKNLNLDVPNIGFNQNFGLGNSNKGSSKIGFEFTQNPNSSENQTDNQSENKNSFGIDICKHCGANFERKTHTQKFCSEKCRVSSWEKENGKKFVPNKKPKNKGLGFFEGFVFVGILCSQITSLDFVFFVVTLLVLLFGFRTFYHKTKGTTESNETYVTHDFRVRSFFWKFRVESIIINDTLKKLFIGFKFHFLEKEFFYKSWKDEPKNKGLGLFEGFVFVGILCSQIDFFVDFLNILYWTLILFVFGFRIVRTKTKYLYPDYVERIFKIEAYLWCFDITVKEYSTLTITYISISWVYVFERYGFSLIRDWKTIYLYKNEKRISPKEKGLGLFESFVGLGILCSQINYIENKYFFLLISILLFCIIIALIEVYFNPKTEKKIRFIKENFHYLQFEDDRNEFKLIFSDLQQAKQTLSFYNYSKKCKSYFDKIQLLEYKVKTRKHSLRLYKNPKIYSFISPLFLWQAQKLTLTDLLVFLVIGLIVAFLFYISNKVNEFIETEKRKSERLRRKAAAAKKQAAKDKLIKTIPIVLLLTLASCENTQKQNLILGDSITSGGFWYQEIKAKVLAKSGAGAKDLRLLFIWVLTIQKIFFLTIC